MIANLLLLKSKSLLYIDDTTQDPQTIQMLGILFEKVLVVTSSDAIALFEDEAPDIILTEIKHVHPESLTHIRKLRDLDYKVPIILIIEDDIHSLLIDIANLSVDGFLRKPFNPATLTNTLCRAIKRNSDESGLVFFGNNLIFNTATNELYLNGSVVTFGVKENQLLSLLITHRSRTLTKEEISKRLWPLDTVSESAIKKLILRIRQKMKTDIIISVRGIGYRLDIRESQRNDQWSVSA